ncbi:hypothetical protein [Vibrio crassostreae]|uniref:hypothetical protein n=1 Tax=Vibrio crassostreae TaxID=246167 RepID=UPI001B30BB53|nr:hypothetical protein [Vibrio crassostreae]
MQKKELILATVDSQFVDFVTFEKLVEDFGLRRLIQVIGNEFKLNQSHDYVLVNKNWAVIPILQLITDYIEQNPDSLMVDDLFRFQMRMEADVRCRGFKGYRTKIPLKSSRVGSWLGKIEDELFESECGLIKVKMERNKRQLELRSILAPYEPEWYRVTQKSWKQFRKNQYRK